MAWKFPIKPLVPNRLISYLSVTKLGICKNIDCGNKRRDKSAYCQECSDKHNGVVIYKTASVGTTEIPKEVLEKFPKGSVIGQDIELANKIVNDLEFDKEKEEICPKCYFKLNKELKRGQCECNKE